LSYRGIPQRTCMTRKVHFGLADVERYRSFLLKG
jgi:hypothetical protein